VLDDNKKLCLNSGINLFIYLFTPFYLLKKDFRHNKK